MAEIRVTTSVEILKANGERDVFELERTVRAGDNPKFLSSEFISLARDNAELLEKSIECRYGKRPASYVNDAPGLRPRAVADRPQA